MQKIWTSDRYYQIAKKASKDSEHPAIQQIRKIAQQGKSVLEVGCGEGSKLNYVVSNQAKGTGIDVSQKAIQIAGKQYPDLTFKVASGEKLPFKDEVFDLVYSAFTLEHTDYPEKVINEMIRVTKPKGYVALVAPNYGAPFRRSPCFTGDRIKRIFQGIRNDPLYQDIFQTSLDWRKVDPINKKDFEIDNDTTVEPYLNNLIRFMKNKKGTITKYSSCWEIAEIHETMVNKIFRVLGTKAIYPFKYWGPHLFLLWRKD